MKYTIWVVWFVLIIAWNYTYPNVHTWEDVFVAVVLSLLNKYLESKYEKN